MPSATLESLGFANWRITFNDDFNDLNLRSKETGTWETQYAWGARHIGDELQVYIDPWYTGSGKSPLGLTPFQIRDGVLRIMARPAGSELLPLLGGQGYTSGLLTTEKSFLQRYGYFEMRARLPAGAGLWPAFWLLQPAGQWPPEIDVFEVRGQEPSSVYMTIHTAERHRHEKVAFLLNAPDTSQSFHRYGVLWDHSSVRWFFDGAEVGRTRTPDDMHNPMYLLINLAVGGEFPGRPDRKLEFPAVLEVDYVRAYALPEKGHDSAK